jgi:hypothetical protein
VPVLPPPSAAHTLALKLPERLPSVKSTWTEPTIVVPDRLVISTVPPVAGSADPEQDASNLSSCVGAVPGGLEPNPEGGATTLYESPAATSAGRPISKMAAFAL